MTVSAGMIYREAALRRLPAENGRSATRETGAVPLLFVVDHDPVSLGVLVSGLSRRFGRDFAVKGESSAWAALAMLRQLAAAKEPVALVLADSAALELLERAHKLHPLAKRVLLVDRDYSSTSPVVQAIARGRANYHIVRPWADDESM